MEGAPFVALAWVRQLVNALVNTLVNALVEALGAEFVRPLVTFAPSGTCMGLGGGTFGTLGKQIVVVGETETCG